MKTLPIVAQQPFINEGTLPTNPPSASVSIPDTTPAAPAQNDSKEQALVPSPFWQEAISPVKSTADLRLVTASSSIPSLRPPYIAAFDFHGTLAQPNWKTALSRAYQRLEPVSDQAAMAWVEENTYGLDDEEVLRRLAATGRDLSMTDANRLFQEERSYVGKYIPIRAFAGALEFLNALNAARVPVFIPTFAHTGRERTLLQFMESGILDLVNPEHIITGDSVRSARDKEEFRNTVLLALHRTHPSAQILFFNDTADGMAVNHQLGGINFGTPQGRGLDWEHRSIPLIASGAHFLIQDWDVNAKELADLLGI